MSGSSPSVGTEIGPLIIAPVGADLVQRYAQASLDFNPIHLSQAAAAAAGLEGPIVHGMFVVGQFERLLRQWRPGWPVGDLSVQFLRPLLVEDDLSVAGRIVSMSAQTWRVRLTARNSAAELIAVGEATVLRQREGRVV